MLLYQYMSILLSLFSKLYGLMELFLKVLGVSIKK